MDFVEWAETAQWLAGRVLAMDDDFAKLDNYDQPQSSYTSVGDTSYYSESVAARPFLNKTSEAELYLLATNFLLCTCLSKETKERINIKTERDKWLHLK